MGYRAYDIYYTSFWSYHEFKIAGLPTQPKLDPTLDRNEAWVAKMNNLVDC